jgi:single-strand DNA-binding protein
LKVPILAARS